MIYESELYCPDCCGRLKVYDHVMRINKSKKGLKNYAYIRRMKCIECGKIHRELPMSVLPYIHYDKAIIFGVLSEQITPNDLDYEDYPCETTMVRWRVRGNLL